MDEVDAVRQPPHQGERPPGQQAIEQPPARHQGDEQDGTGDAVERVQRVARVGRLGDPGRREVDRDEHAEGEHPPAGPTEEAQALEVVPIVQEHGDDAPDEQVEVAEQASAHEAHLLMQHERREGEGRQEDDSPRQPTARQTAPEDERQERPDEVEFLFDPERPGMEEWQVAPLADE